jgi:hypothetical protein
MKFFNKYWIKVAIAIIAVGLVIYIATLSMKKEGMFQQGMPQQGMPQQGMPQQGMLEHLSVVYYSGNGTTGQMNVIDTNPIIWADPHGNDVWQWEEKSYGDGQIKLVSRNRNPVEELLLDFTKSQYLWKPDPNNQNVVAYQITGAQ